MTSLELQGQAAKSAAQTLAVAGTQLKNQALSAIADLPPTPPTSPPPRQTA